MNGLNKQSMSDAGGFNPQGVDTYAARGGALL